MNGAIVSVAVLAKAHRMPVRKMRRRLLNADKLADGKLLVRFSGTSRAHFYVDLVELRRLLPAYAVDPSAVVEPGTSISEDIAAIKSMVASIQNDTAVIRDSVSSV